MSYKHILIHLYYLLIHADGNVNEKEVSVGKQMMSTEGMDEHTFVHELGILAGKDNVTLYRSLLISLKSLPRPRQIRAIGWMCVLANADGFMDRTEWQFIYQVYHKELNLPLEEVMKVQSDLVKITQRQRTIESLREVA